jgi:hypothetical protein
MYMINHGYVTDETISFAAITGDDPVPEPVLKDLEIINDALTLVADLWPVPKSATVVLETHQWEKLRRVLLSIPDLVARVEK